MQIIKGKKRRPRRIILYGPHGIGKSSWATKAPHPLFLNLENGLDDIGVDRTPLITDLDVFHGVISDLTQQPHEYGTVVVDTLDWLEKIVHKKVAVENSKHSIDEIPYYRGYLLCMPHWNFILSSLENLRQARNMAIILLAHACAVKVEPPDGESYTRYEPDLHKEASPLLQEWADEVLFAGYKINKVAKDEGFNRKRHIAIGGDRIVYTCERPTHLAKRRITMPDEIALDFPTYMHYVKLSYAEAENGNGKNINGIVVDGSSKPKTEEEKEPVNV